MEIPVNSSRAIARLPKIRPSKPFLFGIGKILGGCYAGFATAVCLYAGLVFFATGGFLGLLAGPLIILGGMEVLPASIYLFFDGVLSILLSFGKSHSLNQASVYYFHNGGYGNLPSAADEMFGKIVVPLDSLMELKPEKKRCYFLNGVALDNISEHARAIPGSESGTVEYHFKVRCAFQGQSVLAEFDSTDENMVKRFRGAHGSPLYIVAQYVNEINLADISASTTREATHGLMIKDFGLALYEKDMLA